MNYIKVNVHMEKHKENDITKVHHNICSSNSLIVKRKII